MQASRPDRATPRPVLAAAVLTIFTTFSLWVGFTEGFFSWVSLVRREPWALQILLDLIIAAWIAASWMVRDARKRKITVWPYLIVTSAIGSLGLLAYLVHRGVKSPTTVTVAQR
jgi:hypothetical protein